MVVCLSKFGKKSVRAARWFAAISIAAYYSIRRFTPREIWLACLGILGAVFASKRGDASRTLYLRRMMACHRCPIFNRRFGTCGSPLSDHPQLGCWCFMWLKNKMKSARCWLRDNSVDKTLGWRSKLMRKGWQ